LAFASKVCMIMDLALKQAEGSVGNDSINYLLGTRLTDYLN
jgi:hypothetical protein